MNDAVIHTKCVGGARLHADFLYIYITRRKAMVILTARRSQGVDKSISNSSGHGRHYLEFRETKVGSLSHHSCVSDNAVRTRL